MDVGKLAAEMAAPNPSIVFGAMYMMIVRLGEG
jgi:hypothetical protein